MYSILCIVLYSVLCVLYIILQSLVYNMCVQICTWYTTICMYQEDTSSRVLLYMYSNNKVLSLSLQSSSPDWLQQTVHTSSCRPWQDRWLQLQRPPSLTPWTWSEPEYRYKLTHNLLEFILLLSVSFKAVRCFSFMFLKEVTCAVQYCFIWSKLQ